MLALLISSAIVSGAEAAFLSLSKQQLLECKNNKQGRFKLLSELVQQPNKLLSSLLILNNTINVAFVILSTYVLWHFFSPRLVPHAIMVIYTGISAAAIVLFGEIIPKIYATHNNLQIAEKLAGFIRAIVLIVEPLSNIFVKVSNYLGEKVFKEDHKLSIETLEKAIEITTNQVNSAEEKEMLRGIVRFNSLVAKQIMQPRTHIIAINYETDFYKVMEIVSHSGYARFPIYNQTIDHIIGLLYAKDLLPYTERDKDYKWQGLIRKSLFITENNKLDTLLTEFQQSKIHMAVVVDEYGGTSGIITIEDVIEEIVGDIVDEFDKVKQVTYKKIDDKTFEFEGSILLHDFCKILNIDLNVFDEIKEEVESLAGLLLELNKGLPKRGEQIFYKNFRFTILTAGTRKIEKVEVHIVN